MKGKELRAKTVDELKSLLADQKRQALALRFQRASQQLENVSKIRQLRRLIAKVKTILNEKLAGGAHV